ncbi:putative extracelular serine carboxypeptidase, partial [Aspergillus fijiensis CBS 313.89]
EQAQFPIQNLTTPLNHFPASARYPATNLTFPLRYILDTSHYQPGGPVFLIAGGETSALNRLPFLSQGIVHELARIYQGAALIVEHRYYGTSYPDSISQKDNQTIPLSTLTYLTTEQALADYAYLATHLPIPDLSPATTPWIAYGGSYAGAFVAFLRHAHPDLFWASISSSGVTAAIADYWAYYEPIRAHAPAQCVAAQQALIAWVDRVLLLPKAAAAAAASSHGKGSPSGSKDHAEVLKGVFGGSAPGLTDEKFVAGLAEPLGLWQERNWEPSVGGRGFGWFCGNITASEVLDEGLEGEVGARVRGLVREVGGGDGDGDGDGDGKEVEELVTGLVNWVGFVRREGVFSDAEDAEREDEGEREAGDDKRLPRTASTSWNYQVCTEWGYFMPGSTVPAHIAPLVSRLLTPAFWVDMCNATYGITTPPDTDRINRYGGLAFSYPRVAHIGGRADPWKEASPFATGLPVRNSTAEEPMLLIGVPAEEVYDGMEGGVHHWDQNGVFGVEEYWEGKRVVPPRGVREAQGEVIGFVGGWLGEWRETQ